MSTLLAIPKKLLQSGELVIVPRAEYERALSVRKRLLGEEEDTDDAIRVFERERVAGKLHKSVSFAAILDRTGGKPKTKRP